MPNFNSPFSGIANDKKLTHEELVHAGEFLRLLQELAPDEAQLYAQGAKEVEEKIASKKSRKISAAQHHL